LAKHVVRMVEPTNKHRVLEKPLGKCTLVKRRRRWKENVVCVLGRQVVNIGVWMWYQCY